MTDARLAEIRERWAKATPGPWAHDRPPGEVYALSDGSEIIADVYGGPDGRLEPNSAAIAAAPTDIADLLAEVERLRLEFEALADVAIEAVIRIHKRPENLDVIGHHLRALEAAWDRAVAVLDSYGDEAGEPTEDSESS